MLILMTPRTNLSEHDVFADTANRSTGTLDQLPLTDYGFALTALVLFFIGFFGFLLNLIVIFLMIKDKELRTPMNIILFNLVCADFSVSILGNPFTLVSSLSHQWIFGRTMCVMYGFFMSLLGITSISTLTVLSFERYIMISRPFHGHQLTSRGAKLAVAFIWMYSFLLTAPPLIGWGDYVSESAGISCSVNWEHTDLSATTYIIYLFALGLVVPVAIILFSYVNIIVTLRQSTFRNSRVSRAETKVAIMVGAMIVAFLTAWTPYAVMALIVAFGDPEIVSPVIGVIPALMAKSSICYNPIIYAGLNPQFQAAWRKNIGTSRTEDGELTLGSPTTRLKHTHVSYACTKKSTKVSSDGKTSVVGDSGRKSSPQLDPVSEVLEVSYHLQGNSQIVFH